MIILKVQKEDSQKRLDKFLKKELNYSRSYIQKLIKEGRILVNDKIAKPSYVLKENNEIKIDLGKREEEITPSAEIKLDIIYEDDNFLVLNKPAGLLVHPTSKGEKNTLVNALLSYYPKIKNVGEDKLRPGIVHRLDKEASGLLIVAKTQQAFENLKKQFQERKVKKEYLVLVYGKLKQGGGIISLPIGKVKKKGFKVIAWYGLVPSLSKKVKGIKEAVTKFEVLKIFENYTLLKVETITGRTHQIRVHLRAIGHPVVGDNKKNPQEPCLFLHCSKIGFYDLEGNFLEFSKALPKNLQLFLQKLSEKSNFS